MKCYRCDKELVHPDATNADYIMAGDCFSMERQDTGLLNAKGELLIKTVKVPKTGIICPECHKQKDVVLWGVHKCED
ncbi:MAG: hypothetical protein P3T54_00245 [Dehalogenimonas sp.]|nr:hypothetical protein [Dehalogenimonas sp.]